MDTTLIVLLLLTFALPIGFVLSTICGWRPEVNHDVNAAKARQNWWIETKYAGRSEGSKVQAKKNPGV